MTSFGMANSSFNEGNADLLFGSKYFSTRGSNSTYMVGRNTQQ